MGILLQIVATVSNSTSEFFSIRPVHELFYLLLGVIGFFMIRTIRQIDASQKELWSHMNKQEASLAELRGEHNREMARSGHK